MDMRRHGGDITKETSGFFVHGRVVDIMRARPSGQSYRRARSAISSAIRPSPGSWVTSKLAVPSAPLHVQRFIADFTARTGHQGPKTVHPSA
jgi:hypothetical protein